jgi:LAO/AO transport system kinase
LDEESRKLEPIELKELILEGNIRGVAKAITLIESNLQTDRKKAEELLTILGDSYPKSIRIGITGVPGAGKSTFIESFGLHVLSQNKKVAVLAIDPTSPITGGSILGDKTRMPRLAMETNAFIRPSPSSGSLGGVSRKTRETILICEAAGFDVILVETVGVGQSEISVSEMTDFFLLLLIAGAGDELQGIKKGIMEMADLILINKADKDNKLKAELARNEIRSALHYSHSRKDFWTTEVMTISALYNLDIDKVWDKIVEFKTKSGEKLMINRSMQRNKWLFEATEATIFEEILNLKQIDDDYKILEKSVIEGKISVREGVSKIISLLKSK